MKIDPATCNMTSTRQSKEETQECMTPDLKPLKPLFINQDDLSVSNTQHYCLTSIDNALDSFESEYIISLVLLE